MSTDTVYRPTSLDTAEAISKYLLTGMHSSTKEGQAAIAELIDRQARIQNSFWVDCLREVIRDKDQQIIALKQTS